MIGTSGPLLAGARTLSARIARFKSRLRTGFYVADLDISRFYSYTRRPRFGI